jgi:signal transduction histidine kinase
MNAATARAEDLPDTVIREAATMRRQVDHHLARARAVGRRGMAQARANVGESVEGRAARGDGLYEKARFDLDGDRGRNVAIERQDLDEMLGNLIENAAKYGGGSVFVTLDPTNDPDSVRGLGRGRRPWHSSRSSNAAFSIAARGSIPASPAPDWALAIVRDVAEIYLGGLLVRLTLPAG